MRVCLDTNAYSRLMRNQAGLQRCLEEAEIIHVPTIVLGELYAGFCLGSRYEDNCRELEAFLRSLMSVEELKVLVPGHGPVIYGRSEGRDWIEWEADYLASVRDRVREKLRQGMSSSAAVEAAGYDEFVGTRLPRDPHNMPKRHRNTVEKIVEEEEASEDE